MCINMNMYIDMYIYIYIDMYINIIIYMNMKSIRKFGCFSYCLGVVRNMTLEGLLPLASLIMVIASFAVGRVSAGKEQGKQDGIILGELGYVKSSVDDVKHKLDRQDEQYANMKAEIAAVKQSTAQAHHRIDEIRQHCCGD